MPKARVTFDDIEQTVNVPAGTRFMEVSDKIGAGITSGCQEGDRGACMMHVTEGWNNPTEPSVLAEKILREIGKVTKSQLEQMIVDDLPSEWRLACQMIVRDEHLSVEF
jgi:ferredoxin